MSPAAIKAHTKALAAFPESVTDASPLRFFVRNGVCHLVRAAVGPPWSLVCDCRLLTVPKRTLLHSRPADLPACVPCAVNHFSVKGADDE